MRTDITCTLNGHGLAVLDSSIYIEDISEEVTVEQETIQRAPYGMFPLNNPGRSSVKIKVKFMIKEKDRTDRMTVIQKVRGWATNGWFTMNTRPDQRLYVFCTKPPALETFDWKARMEMEFSAYGEAFWQDVTPVTVVSDSAASSATVSITPTGTQDTFLEAEIAPSSGTLTSVSITSGGRTIALSGLSVTSSAPLEIYYDELHILHIESGGTSLLSKRSAASADDIILKAGRSNSVSLTFGRACNYTIKARGLWK